MVDRRRFSRRSLHSLSRNPRFLASLRLFSYTGNYRSPTPSLSELIGPKKRPPHEGGFLFVDLVRNQWNEILRELAEWNQLKIAHEALLTTR